MCNKKKDIKEPKKRIMLAGAVDAGKTTLMKALFHDGPVSMEKDKTQSMGYDTCAIDTPGEFTAIPWHKGALFATSLEADLVLFLHDATTGYIQFPPGFATAFPRRSVGVITKIVVKNGIAAWPEKEDFEILSVNPVKVQGEGKTTVYIAEGGTVAEKTVDIGKEAVVI